MDETFAVEIVTDRQKQAGGDGSANIQVGRDIIIQQGLSVLDVLTVCRQEIIPSLFRELSTVARQAAEARAEELLESLLARMSLENPDSINSAMDPDFQFGLISAQKAYARTGKTEIRDLLVDILARRAASSGSDLQVLCLNSAVEVAQRVTPSQLAGLTALLMVGELVPLGLESIDELADFLRSGTEPLLDLLPIGRTWFPYLQSIGCLNATVGLDALPIEQIWGRAHPGLFSRGLDEAELIEIRELLPPELLTPNPTVEGRLRVAAANVESLVRGHPRLFQEDRDDQKKNAISTLMTKTLREDHEIVHELILRWPAFDKLRSWWSQLPSAPSLTTVGITIAHANLLRVSGLSEVELSIWIENDS